MHRRVKNNRGGQAKLQAKQQKSSHSNRNQDNKHRYYSMLKHSRLNDERPCSNSNNSNNSAKEITTTRAKSIEFDLQQNQEPPQEATNPLQLADHEFSAMQIQFSSSPSSSSSRSPKLSHRSLSGIQLQHRDRLIPNADHLANQTKGPLQIRHAHSAGTPSKSSSQSHSRSARPNVQKALPSLPTQHGASNSTSGLSTNVSSAGSICLDLSDPNFMSSCMQQAKPSPLFAMRVKRKQNHSLSRSRSHKTQSQSRSRSKSKSLSRQHRQRKLANNYNRVTTIKKDRHLHRLHRVGNNQNAVLSSSPQSLANKKEHKNVLQNVSLDQNSTSNPVSTSSESFNLTASRSRAVESVVSSCATTSVPFVVSASTSAAGSASSSFSFENGNAIKSNFFVAPPPLTHPLSLHNVRASIFQSLDPKTAELIFLLLEILVFILLVCSLAAFIMALYVASLDLKKKESAAPVWFLTAELYWNMSMFGILLTTFVLLFAASEKHLHQRELLYSFSPHHRYHDHPTPAT